jgi:hypothetical protein
MRPARAIIVGLGGVLILLVAAPVATRESSGERASTTARGVPYAGPALLRAAFMDLQHFGVLRIEHDPAAGDLSTTFITESGDVEDDTRVACRV